MGTGNNEVSMRRNQQPPSGRQSSLSHQECTGRNRFSFSSSKAKKPFWPHVCITVHSDFYWDRNFPETLQGQLFLIKKSPSLLKVVMFPAKPVLGIPLRWTCEPFDFLLREEVCPLNALMILLSLPNFLVDCGDFPEFSFILHLTRFLSNLEWEENNPSVFLQSNRRYIKPAIHSWIST